MNLTRPLKSTIKTYNKSFFINDLIAGITVAVIAIPQAMAFALLAGIKPIYGLYTAIVSTIVASVFSTSSHIINGPANATCLLIAGSLVYFTELPEEQYLNVILLLTLMVGVIQLVFGMLNLGQLLNYVSRSVINGFTVGAAFLIIFGQINKTVGLTLPPGLAAYEKFVYVIMNITHANAYTVVITLLTAAVIIIMKKVNELIPGPLVAMILTGALVYIFNLGSGGVNVIGETSVSVPKFYIFSFDLKLVPQLFSGAISLVIIGLVSTISMAKAISKETHEKIDVNQEFVTQGISNIVSSFFLSFAGTTSVSRTALNYYSGAKTRFAGVFSGVFIFFSLLFLGKFIPYIPTSSLAIIIILTAVKMINIKDIYAVLHASRKDFVTTMVTIAAVILMPKLDIAVLLGTMISIFIYLYESGSSNTVILHYVAFKDSFVEIPPEKLKEDEDIIAVVFDSNLYFGLANNLDELLSEILDNSKKFILRFRRVCEMDLTAYEAISDFSKKIVEKGGNVVICGVNDKLYKFLDRNHYFKIVDRNNVFKKEETFFSSFEKALSKMKLLTIKKNEASN